MISIQLTDCTSYKNNFYTMSFSKSKYWVWNFSIIKVFTLRKIWHWKLYTDERKLNILRFNQETNDFYSYFFILKNKKKLIKNISLKSEYVE